MHASRDDQPLQEEGRIGTAIDALLERFAEPAIAASRNRSPVTTSERALAAAIELVFGLFLLSGMGFVYLGQRVVGWVVLLLRVFAVYVGASAIGSASPTLGLIAGVALWVGLPVGLAFIVFRSTRPPRGSGERGGVATASLEGLGYLGIGGFGWISAGRPAVGIPILVVRFLMLGAGVFFLPLGYLAYADSCVAGLANCTALWIGLLIWFFFLLALWLAFPIVSAALLRRAQLLAARQGKETYESVPS